MTSLFFASSGGFWAPIADPIASVLAFFYSLVPNYAIAIVMLTIAMMIVLIPLTIKQTRSMLVMQKLQPEMKRLQEQHKNDRQALNEAVMALYKEHNASPLGGCLPMLLPFPLFIALYRVLEGLSHLVHKGKVVMSQPEYLSKTTRMYQDIVKAHGKLDSFGLDLAKTARNAGGGFAHSLPYFVLLLLMVGTQFYQQYQLTSKNPAMKSQPGQAMMMKVIPLVFGVISLAFPAGVIVYWTVSNIFRIGQQWALYRYDPKVIALVTQDVKEVEAKTREIDAAEKREKAARPRFRDLLSNASQAAADRRSPTGKADPRSAGRAGGDKGASGRNGSTGGTKKPAGSTPAKAGGAQKVSPQKASPQKGVAPKAPVAKTAPGKASASKAPPPKAGGVAKSGASGAPGAAGAPKGAAVKPGASGAVGSKTVAAKTGSAAGPVTGNGSARTSGDSGTSGANGSNGRSKAVPTGGTDEGRDRAESAAEGFDGAEVAASTADDTAATPAATNGAPRGRTGAGRTGGGRTGGGNARTVNSSRRRRGR